MMIQEVLGSMIEPFLNLEAHKESSLDHLREKSPGLLQLFILQGKQNLIFAQLCEERRAQGKPMDQVAGATRTQAFKHQSSAACR
jgi:hypothetical protein